MEYFIKYMEERVIMYYDNESQLKQSMEDVIDNFLENLSNYHINQNANEIKKILNLTEFYDNNNNDNTIFKYVAIRGNNNVKKIISVIRQIIAEKVFNIWIGNVLKLWNDKTNKLSSEEIPILYNKCNFENEYESNRIINFKIDTSLWNMFTIKCRRMNLTNANGFKFALLYFIMESEEIKEDNKIIRN